MKTAAQLTASTLALAILLGAAASPSHATTPIAALPLKAAVLAKPNIIFAMDDSGSMDWEVLFDTNSGQVFWRQDAVGPYGSAWDTANNRPFRSMVTYSPLSYLFPMGTGTGGALYSSTDGNGRAAPPIGQLAWLRSSAFNPLYYNTMASYPAWSPGYVGGSTRTFANQPPNAAPSHPGQWLGGSVATLNVGADWNSGSTNWSNNADTDFTFRVLAGMVLPIGTRVPATTSSSGICSGGMQTLTAATVVPSGASCRASIPYYPATFWQRTVCKAGDASCVPAPDCVVEDPTVNPGTACVNSPDGLGKLRRYEIKSGNSFPSGRTHAQELQNFANWFSYYRKRKLMLAASMGGALEKVTGLRMGVVAFCTDDCVAPTMYDADSLDDSQNRLAAAGRFYPNAMAAQGTPTHATMNYVAGQFNTNTNVVQYACQRNSSVVVTDGFSNTATFAVPPWDSGKSASTWGASAPFQSIANQSLADHALRHYTNRLRASGGSALPAGRLPPGNALRYNPDLNPDLHITTYGITLGARGTLFPAAQNPFDVDVFANPPTWPTPVADSPEMIDDLWHATVNGRGRMYLANDAASTKAAIQSTFNDILDQTGAQGGVAVSTVNLPRGDSKAYFGTYNPAGWAGDLTANPINPATGSVNVTPLWSAAEILAQRDWTTRIIGTSNGSSVVDFSAANVGSTVNPGGVYGTDSAVIGYLRGDTSGEGTSFRARPQVKKLVAGNLTLIGTNLLGAVINSEPVVSREDSVVYVASSEGMLHAFDTSSGNAGKELWAFVPRQTLANIGKTVERGYTFQTKLDGSPVLGRYSASGKLLVAGMGASGRGYFALDVSNPRVASPAGLGLKWEFPAAGASAELVAKVGQTLGRPVIVKTQAHGHVVLVTSGHNNSFDGKGRLWMLNAGSGAVIKEFTTGDGTLANQAGLAHVTAFDEGNGTVRYAYGGDLLGNVWSFDLADASATPTPAKVAVLTGPGGQAQPVTAAPELLNVEGKRVVMIGTGRLLDIGDFGKTTVQSIYAIADTGTTLSTPRSSLAQQTYVRGATPAQDTLTGPTVDWSTGRGWFIDLPAGEQINTRPTIAYGGLAFVSNLNGGSDCTAKSYLYVVNALSGKKFKGTDFIGTVVSETSNSSGVTALLTTGQKIVGAGQDADGKPWERQITSGVPILPGKNAWIEIRRQ
jgi:type IV pilus assembly protein PilY1